MEMRDRKNFRLSETCQRLLALLAAKLGISQTAVIETAVRLLAKRERIKEENLV